MSLYFGNIQQLTVPAISFPELGLKAYWKLDETSGNIAYDSKGSADGNISNSSIINNTGKNNKGLLLPASQDDYDYSISINSRFGITDVPLTISWWMREAGGYSTSDVGAMWHIGDDGARYTGWLCYYYQGYLYTQIGNGGVSGAGARYGVIFNNVHDILSDGEWHHCLAQLTAYNDHKMFVDGVEITNKSTSGFASSIDWGNNTSKFFRYAGANRTANLYFDEAAIWNRVLTQQEITDLYNNGNGLFY